MAAVEEIKVVLDEKDLRRVTVCGLWGTFDRITVGEDNEELPSEGVVARKGLQKEDRIILVNGQSTAGMDATQVMEMVMAGKSAGRPLEMVVQREVSNDDFTEVREPQGSAAGSRHPPRSGSTIQQALDRAENAEARVRELEGQIAEWKYVNKQLRDLVEQQVEELEEANGNVVLFSPEMQNSNATDSNEQFKVSELDAPLRSITEHLAHMGIGHHDQYHIASVERSSGSSDDGFENTEAQCSRVKAREDAEAEAAAIVAAGETAAKAASPMLHTVYGEVSAIAVKALVRAMARVYSHRAMATEGRKLETSMLLRIWQRQAAPERVMGTAHKVASSPILCPAPCPTPCPIS